MITISFDEYGKFEDYDSERKAGFIAGIVYDDLGKTHEVNNEKQRIRTFLESVCKSAEAQYPTDLHVNNKEKNNRNVEKVKSQLNKSFPDFIKSGTYQGRPVLDDRGHDRKGKYYLFLIYKGNHTSNVNSFSADMTGSNRYLNMAERILSRVAFHNPLIGDARNIKFDLPSRETTDIDDTNKLKEYKTTLSYRAKPSKDSEKVHFSIANEDVYRTFIQNELDIVQDSAHYKIDFRTSSICYKPDDSRTLNQGFLYLSDYLCSYLQREGEESSGNAFFSYDRLIRNIVDDRTLAFVYDDIDDLYMKAYDYYEHGLLYDAFDQLYKSASYTSQYLDYYQTHWFEVLTEKIINTSDADKLSSAAVSLNRSAYQTTVDQAELIFIYRWLYEIYKRLINAGTYIDSHTIYLLFDAGMSAYNHLGRYTDAEACYRECVKHRTDMGIDQYMRIRNKYAVMMQDSFRFSEALKIATENTDYQKEINDVIELMFDEETVIPAYGRAFSQRGQAKSCLKDKTAADDFEIALGQFDPTKADYWITLSYYMHFCIEMKNRSEYEKLAEVYFGSKEPGEQFNLLMEETKRYQESPEKVIHRYSFKFALYVYVKALYVFYYGTEKVNKKLINQVIDIEQIMKENGITDLKDVSGHPWEIIWKYLALLALRVKKDVKLSKIYMDKTEKSVENGQKLISWIVEFGKIEYLMCIDEPGKQAQVVNIERSLLHDICESCQIEEENVFNKEQAYSKLKQYMVYMYH